MSLASLKLARLFLCPDRSSAAAPIASPGHRPRPLRQLADFPCICCRPRYDALSARCAADPDPTGCSNNDIGHGRASERVSQLGSIPTPVPTLSTLPGFVLAIHVDETARLARSYPSHFLCRFLGVFGARHVLCNAGSIEPAPVPCDATSVLQAECERTSLGGST